MLEKIKKVFYFINIALHLHSKAPNKEIKRNWEIFALCGMPVLILTLFSGFKLWFITLPKINFINDYGAFIFLFFVFIYMIIFFDYKKCKDITAKNNQKHNKS